MLFSIPLFVFFSSICFLTEQMKNESHDEEITTFQNNKQANNVETMEISNHQVDEPILNFQRKEMFKECRRNHASGIGGFAVDGCCEFLPAGIEGTIEFFKCAACNCHRNFHHKELVTGDLTNFPANTVYYPSPTPISTIFPIHDYIHMTGSSRGTINGGEERLTSFKKRFRTKFSREQKEKMFNFAVKLGWKVRKQDKNAVEKFCNKIGVKFQVFKVWILNNKHTIGKQP
ncbi:unnamed protein product [Lathyrus oleraceus]